MFKCRDVGIDAEKFTYFTLSVAWRRAIHDWISFDDQVLPRWELGAFGEQLRAFYPAKKVFRPILRYL